MHNGEWSLISFTLLSQLSVGLVLGLGFVFFTQQSIYDNLISGFSFKSPEFIILILVVVATLLSLLHLGNPLHSYHSLNNLKGSWISREILMLSIFGFVMLLFMISKMLSWPELYPRIFIVFSMISGVGLILSMIGIYMIPIVPAWNNFFTPLSFFGSSFLLGSVGIILIITLGNSIEINHDFFSKMFVFMLLVVGIIIIATGFHQYQLSQYQFTGIDQMQFVKGMFFTLFLIRMVLLLVAIIGLIYLVKVSLQPSFSFTDIKTIFILISVGVLLSEIIGRYQFYGSYFRVGV